MTTPAFLMFAVLAFWGWQINMLWVGLLMGFGLEVSRWVKVRWEFSDVDLQRIWSLVTLLFLGGQLSRLYLMTARVG